MKNIFAERLVILVFFSLTILCLISFIKTQVVFSATSHLVISEVQIAGTGGANEDFIEIYNPTNTSIDLNGYRIVKRTASGTIDSSIKAWNSETIIPSHGHYLWANSSWTPSTTPDTTTASTLAADNGIAIRQGLIDTGTIIDSVAWGNAINAFVETSSFPTNPEAGKSIERIGDDTNNNSVDFILQENPNPQSLGYTPSPTESLSPTLTGILSPTPTIQPSPASGVIVINEVAWAGTLASADDEWIELYNTSESGVDLTNWTLTATDGTPNITLTGSVSAKGYFLLERSSDDTVKNITADQIYSGALGNTGESLELKNASSQLVDTANSDSGVWPAGDNTARKSMERVNPNQAGSDDNWATNDGVTINGIDATDNNILGTPKNQNSVYQGTTPSPTPTGVVTPTPTSIPSATPTQSASPSPTSIPSPTLTSTPTPTSQPTLTPTPHPSPTPIEKIIATFDFPGKTITCSISFKVKVHKFFIMIIPKISCK